VLQQNPHQVTTPNPLLCVACPCLSATATVYTPPATQTLRMYLHVFTFIHACMCRRCHSTRHASSSPTVSCSTVHTHTHTHTHIHTHTHTHTHTHRLPHQAAPPDTHRPKQGRRTPTGHNSHFLHFPLHALHILHFITFYILHFTLQT
jgi:hypothetical protein